MTKIAVIGVGHMGKAMIEGFKKADNEIIAQNPVNPRVSRLAKELDFKLFNAINDLIAENPEIIILTTPAKVTLQVASQLRNTNEKTIIISAAAGVTYNDLKTQLPNQLLARIIPNTPVAVNQGTIGLYLPENISSQDHERITSFLKQLGDVIAVKEDQLSIVGTIAGCGPAFVDVFLDALGDSGVLNGLPRKLANNIASSMVKGAASLAYESKQAPSLLRDEVCSPGGTTIKGVTSLEKNGFRNAVIEAVNAANQN
ncbi:pyrroline-5-carboxylate reductase [uncultured Lactobacillus sp.]|uniref:pyrroline-5-carboxylate reductase n=1 Tax=uncultured Lactobacillus sp. TaxID=153152 RepID=UPI002638B822|nr:pyrroline-5-carboxylate reductase [uncultured Lactobacillus sp.]